MGQSTTLYRFHIHLSDIDQGVYKTLDLRLAMHPSESHAYLITRLIAYALNEQEFLEFAAEGLGDPDAPAISAATPNGEIRLWIEIGNPSARKLHKAAKAARKVLVYTYKDPEPLLKEIRANKVYHAESIGIHSIDPRFLEKLAARLERTNAWGILLHEKTLNVSVGDVAEVTDLREHPVADP
ncbi:MAG TPA: YaeQ family protein [Fibrobacteria bacterium]|nr:YaeQ family protein [Fibrobacteria bacterium]